MLAGSAVPPSLCGGIVGVTIANIVRTHLDVTRCGGVLNGCGAFSNASLPILCIQSCKQYQPKYVELCKNLEHQISFSPTEEDVHAIILLASGMHCLRSSSDGANHAMIRVSFGTER